MLDCDDASEAEIDRLRFCETQGQGLYISEFEMFNKVSNCLNNKALSSVKEEARTNEDDDDGDIGVESVDQRRGEAPREATRQSAQTAVCNCFSTHPPSM